MYYVYKHTFPDSKVYIGCTQMKPEIRFGVQGAGYINVKRVWSAIQEFGWDNIEHTILLTTTSREEAALAELNYIQQYAACNPDRGYNTYNRSLGKPMKTLPAIVGIHISQAKKNTVCINRNGVYRYVKFDALAEKLDEGWQRGGRSINLEQKLKISESNSGTVSIHKDGDYHKVKIETLSQLEAEGWSVGGRPLTDEQRRHLSEINTGKQYSAETREKLSRMRTGLIVVHKDGANKRIHPEELADYLNAGWIRGVSEAWCNSNSDSHRGTVQSEETKQRRSDSMQGMHKGKKQIHKDDMRKMVALSEIDAYLADGWALGVGPRAKPIQR